MSIYDYSVRDAKGETVAMEEYRGKVLVIVNTATGCGFTPQYEGLEALYEKYREKGLEILDFPCNQFGGQAPEPIEEIGKFCTLKYRTTFRLFDKVRVNGDGEEPLFTYLKSCKSGFFGSNIKWNFTKFLVDREGKVVRRFAPVTPPEEMENSIIKLI